VARTAEASLVLHAEGSTVALAHIAHLRLGIACLDGDGRTSKGEGRVIIVLTERLAAARLKARTIVGASTATLRTGTRAGLTGLRHKVSGAEELKVRVVEAREGIAVVGLLALDAETDVWLFLLVAVVLAVLRCVGGLVIGTFIALSITRTSIFGVILISRLLWFGRGRGGAVRTVDAVVAVELDGVHIRRSRNANRHRPLTTRDQSGFVSLTANTDAELLC
jgi:hypothetical protein